MTAPLPSDQPSDLAAPTVGSADWARPVFERQVARLDRLADIGMGLAETLGREVQAPSPEADEPANEPAAAAAAIFLAYARVSRAVRLTLMLQSKLIGDFQEAERRQAQADRFAVSRQGFDRDGRAERQRDRVARIVERIAERQGQDWGDAERLGEDAAERLDQDDLYGDILARPLGELVALICRDLGVEPDWPQMAEEAWAQDEIAAGASVWPPTLAAPDRPPKPDSPIRAGAREPSAELRVSPA